MTGTTPPGTENEQQASRWVREMFGRIAPRYDLANHLLSFNIDRIWRRRLIERVMPELARSGTRVLDVCCGTGDLTIALARQRKQPVIGSDFSHPMLQAAARKTRAPLFEADALHLPVADGSVDLITCAFGFRNLTNYDAGLKEFRRVLKSGGKLAILEFSQPRNALFRAVYEWYSRRVLPPLGAALSGAKDAYAYLPESVKKFPGPEELAEQMRARNFQSIHFELWTGGIVALHTALA